VRRNNEDCFLADAESGVYLVADGMGGARAGETASHIAVTVARERLAAELPPRTHAAVEESFGAANREVLMAAQANPEFSGMGTTLVGLIESGDEALVSSVGDSRAWLFENDVLRPITEDQSWVQEVGRRLGLDEQTLKTHPMRHVLTMAVGIGEELRINSYRLTPPAGALFLLSSDGLHGVVPPEEIEKILFHEISLEAKGHSLIKAARDAGGPDNITILLVLW
jgi:serine/threonine protein phosphatase PrpC